MVYSASEMTTRGISEEVIEWEGYAVEDWLLEVIQWSPFYRQLARCIASIPTTESRVGFMNEAAGMEGDGDEGGEHFLQKNVDMASLSDRAVGLMSEALGMINDSILVANPRPRGRKPGGQNSRR